VSGDRQTRSSRFDPEPQFEIHEVERIAGLDVVVTGRCWFEPIVAGTMFTAYAIDNVEGDPEVCRLRVEAIEAYGHLLAELAQTVSARLSLRGAAPVNLRASRRGEYNLLIGAEPDEVTWSWDGQLWRLL
jgi:hypothetical protein